MSDSYELKQKKVDRLNIMGKESNQDAADKQREKADLWKKMTDENAARAEREWKREEEAANRAARELQEKKKKKRRKIRVAVLLIFVIAAAGTFGGLRYQQYQKEKASQEADVLALADGEELVYGKITKAVGNDITVTILDVKTDTASDDEKVEGGDLANSTADEQSGSGNPDSQSANAENPGNASQSSEVQENAEQKADEQSAVPSKAGDQGNMQEMSGQSGAAPGGNDQGGAPEIESQGEGTQKAADNQNTANARSDQAQSVAPQNTNTLQYTEMSQTKEYEVPVGCEVTTRLGATTSFSRLSTGNIIGIVLQSGTDNILRIKIVE